MQAASNQPDILVIVFDAFCSKNMSLFGYARDTTPHLNALVETATVYHNHYAAGNFTTPGTASLLTGTYPWAHRAIQINSSVDLNYHSRHIYRLFSDYHSFTYSHNQLVTLLQNQFTVDIDSFKPREDLTLGENKWLSKVFHRDEDIATVSWARATGKAEDGLSTSLFLPTLFDFLSERRNQRMEDQFPLGLPISSLDHFLLEDAVDWLISAVKTLPQPFLGYCHFLPPHAPYNTRREFADRFLHADIPNPSKPKHPLAKPGRVKQEHGLDHYRRVYDEYILYVDAEFNRLYQALKEAGILENAYLILTSDHGEMFERGIMGHSTPSLHEPVVRIPLLIFEPGQKKGVDVYAPTNAVDLLPTLLHLTGRPIPAWIEGSILPPYQPADPERSIFALEAKTNQPSKPLRSASALIRKGPYKLTKYFGYGFLRNSDTLVELYDLDNDPEEMNNLFETKPETASELLQELETKIQTADERYQ
jgi:choline-sulfatase